MNSLEQREHHFYEHGWIVVKLPNPDPVYAARAALLKELRRLTGSATLTLEQYHEIAQEDDLHTDWQTQLTQLFRTERFGYKIIAAQLDFFKAFLGPDINVQSNPYLRITRPGKPQDNIGYHRDTFYGGSPFELSVLVPFVEVPTDSSLSVLSGSHIRPGSDFPTRQIESSDVKKGSIKHQLGFLYAPKLMDSAFTVDMQPVPLKLGEVLIFSLSTVHGSVENRGKHSRWSSDIRVINALAPAAEARAQHYEPLCRSVVTELANMYNTAQSTNLVQV